MIEITQNDFTERIGNDLTFDEYSGVPADLVLKKIRELIFDEKKR